MKDRMFVTLLLVGTPRQMGASAGQALLQAEEWENWWPEVESNHRHEDFQSSALPTELSGLMRDELRVAAREEPQGFLRVLPRPGAGVAIFLVLRNSNLYGRAAYLT